MTKLLSLAAVIGVSFFCVAATSAMPLAPLEQTEASLTIPVAGGCNGYYGGGYYGGAVAPGVAPGVVVTAPGVVVAPRAVGPMLVCLLIELNIKLTGGPAKSGAVQVRTIKRRG